MARKKSMPPPDYEGLYRRHMELTREVEHLSTLREIGLAISGTLEMSETLSIIAHVVQGALDVRRLTLYTPSQEGDFLQPVVAKYGNDLITKERLEEEFEPRKGSLLGKAIDSRSVTLLNVPGNSRAVVPLMAKGEPLGVMVLEDRRDGQPFSDDDAALFQQLGSQIAIAMHNAQLYAMAVTDGLTGLYVRRYFDLRMQEEFAQAQRYKRVFSVMLFDIDHFKKFNDLHGHQTGDRVLQQFARLLQKNTRRSDICCRYGGEEMTVILPETDLQEAALSANKLCGLVRSHPFTGMEEQVLSVTTSIGVSVFGPEYGRPESMVEAADRALYQAKQLGRNRVELAGI
ncbi:MAG TPA: GGDEF domain-containing protein [Candidatus Hydrogenedentes bacterium]|nr:GGDEF domain-containing protein [Candidatus Hydrogenedentota bacterium]